MTEGRLGPVDAGTLALVTRMVGAMRTNPPDTVELLVLPAGDFVADGILRETVVRLVASELSGTLLAETRVDRRCQRCGHPRHGRPEVVPRVFTFSWSTTTTVNMLALTVSRVPIGLDVEWSGRDESAAEILMEFATASESASVMDAADALTLWTRKEAVLKADGTGLAVDLPHTEVGLTRTAVRLSAFLTAPSWSLSSIDPGVPDLVACLAVPADRAMRLRRWVHPAVG